MPQHKPARKAPSIDMTAMCDVAFLLLTFFMLTAKAKPTETVIVDTPSSISETKLPDVGTLTILLSKEGNVFLDPSGSQSRKGLITYMNAQYQMGLNEKDMALFANLGSFGVPYARMREYLRAEPAERNKIVDGIPIDTADINKNELANWIHQARLAQFAYKKELINEGKAEIKEYAIVVKADKDTPYPAVQKVINTLTDINVNKFNLITQTEGDATKKEAAQKSAQ